MSGPARHAWIDASAGVAGDMLLGALIDAGAGMDAVQQAIDLVIPGSVRLQRTEVTRAGLRATKIDVAVLVDDPPHRSWRTIQAMLSDSRLPANILARALVVFGRLADAEGRVHGTPPEDVVAQVHDSGRLERGSPPACTRSPAAPDRRWKRRQAPHRTLR